MNERRAVQRTRVLKNAEIRFGDRLSRIHCTLLDLSHAGAQLSLMSTYRIPDTFDLTFDRGRSQRKCRVAWRDGNKLGVAFVTSESETDVDVAAANAAAESAPSGDS